jgi:hypothetical protein
MGLHSVHNALDRGMSLLGPSRTLHPARPESAFGCKPALEPVHTMGDHSDTAAACCHFPHFGLRFRPLVAGIGAAAATGGGWT